VATWNNPAQYMRVVARSHRRDFWRQQLERIVVWPEKGTVRGVLQPVLEEYGVGFRVLHGSGSATIVNDASQDDDGRPLTIFYIGDFDPSGLWMSERDIPERLERYGGGHITVKRIALRRADCTALGSHPASISRRRGSQIVVAPHPTTPECVTSFRNTKARHDLAITDPLVAKRSQLPPAHRR
jgi:hypothetical protein